MSKDSFEAAINAAGFNDSTTKISKMNLKRVMNEIRDGIWGGACKLQRLDGYINGLQCPGAETTFDFNSGLTVDKDDFVLVTYKAYPSNAKFFKLDESIKSSVIELKWASQRPLFRSECMLKAISGSLVSVLNGRIEISVPSDTGNKYVHIKKWWDGISEPASSLHCTIYSMHKLVQ